jgi:ribonuclease HI
MKDEENKNSIIIFTDGSVTQEGGGAAAVTDSLHLSVSIEQSQVFSNHETELIGISLAARLAKDLIRQRIQQAPDIAIFSDNQGVLRLIHDTPRASSGQHLTIQIRSLFKQLPIDTAIRFYWTPGHAGIELNEKADNLAKQATTNQVESIKIPASLGSLKRLTKDKFHIKHLPLKPGTKPYTARPKDVSNTLMNMEKGRAASIFQLRAGHSPLNAHLYKRNIVDSPLCNTCKLKETTEHFLLYCNRYKKARKRFRTRLRKEEVKVNWNNAKKLLDSPKAFFLLSDFILETQRFVFFHSYTQDSDQRKQTRNKGWEVNDPQ